MDAVALNVTASGAGPLVRERFSVAWALPTGAARTSMDGTAAMVVAPRPSVTRTFGWKVPTVVYTKVVLPELLLMVQVWIGQGRAGEAASALQSWVALHPHDAAAWQMLGRANTAQGQTLRAIRAQAEAQVALMDYAAAVDRFKAAQGLSLIHI